MTDKAFLMSLREVHRIFGCELCERVDYLRAACRVTFYIVEQKAVAKVDRVVVESVPVKIDIAFCVSKFASLYPGIPDKQEAGDSQG